MAEQTLDKVKKLDPVGLTVYGEMFTGFHRIADIVDLLPSFKEFYYTERIKDPNITLTNILRRFNLEVCLPMDRTFFPWMSAIRGWRRKWDADLANQILDKDILPSTETSVRQIIKTRNDENAVVVGAPSDSDLEAGVRSLGGELLNDAMQMLRDDQQLEEIYEPEVLVKRRAYIVNVFAHATKLVHGKAALMLKASEEKRNNAGFLMGLLAKASSGKMSDEEMNLLKTAYKPKADE